VTFSKARIGTGGIWVGLPLAALSGHDEKSVYFDKATGGFFLNPIAFFDLITDLILNDFVTYAGSSTNYQLPAVYTPSTVAPGTVPTTGLPLTTTFVSAPLATPLKQLRIDDFPPKS
jgi:hypothetical protein